MSRLEARTSSTSTAGANDDMTESHTGERSGSERIEIFKDPRSTVLSQNGISHFGRRLLT